MHGINMDMVQLYYMYMHICKCTRNVRYIYKQKMYTWVRCTYLMAMTVTEDLSPYR